jgi:hypothetical protein
MPDFFDISHINMDMFQMQKNQSKPSNSNNPCTVCPLFVYFQFPPKGIPTQFQPVTFDQTNSYIYNVLNFSFPPEVDPIIYISTNANFTVANLQSFKPIGFQITQKIHTSTAMTTSTNNDLQMIIECKSVANAQNELFLHIMLTNDLNTKNNNIGGDFNTLFSTIQTTNLNTTNILQFQTENVKQSPTNLNFFSGINNQLLTDGTYSDQSYMLCFYYKDDNNNTHIILQNPIPISHPNFAYIQNYFQKTGLAQNPFNMYTNTTLAPSQSSSVIKDTLLFADTTLTINQKKTPLTADEYSKKKAQDKVDERTAKDVKKVNETFINRGGKITEGLSNYTEGLSNYTEGLSNYTEGLSNYTEGLSNYTEGLTTMNCKVANASKNLVSTLVSDSTQVSNLDGYILLISLSVFFLVIFAMYFFISRNMFFFEFIVIKTIDFDTDISIEKVFTFFEKINLLRTIMCVILILIAVVFCIPSFIPGIDKTTQFPLLLIGIVCLIIALIGYNGCYFFNEPIKDNRYSYTYRIIKTYMESFKRELLNEKFDTTDDTGIYKKTPGSDNAENIYNFINMCVSYYYGDKKWFTEENDNTIINNISYDDKNKNILVAEKIATFDKENKLT